MQDNNDVTDSMQEFDTNVDSCWLNSYFYAICVNPTPHLYNGIYRLEESEESTNCKSSGSFEMEDNLGSFDMKNN